MEKSDKFDVHHIIPVSLNGENHPDNLKPLTVPDHKLVHATMNINTSLTRKLRELLNSTCYLTKEIVNYEQEIRSKYFARLGFLPDGLIDTHLASLSDQASRWLGKVWEQSSMSHCTTPSDIADDKLYSIAVARRMIAEDLENTVKHKHFNF